MPAHKLSVTLNNQVNLWHFFTSKLVSFVGGIWFNDLVVVALGKALLSVIYLIDRLA